MHSGGCVKLILRIIRERLDNWGSLAGKAGDWIDRKRGLIEDVFCV